MTLHSSLKKFNRLFGAFSKKYPKKEWTSDFKENLKNDFIYYSTHVEGNKINYGDTLKFLKNGLIAQNSSLRDITDLTNHKKILDKIFSFYAVRSIDEHNIKEMHRVLMNDTAQWNNVIDVYNITGDYRQDQRYGTRENGYKEYMIFHKITAEMQKLVAGYNQMIVNSNINYTETHPVYIAAWFHNKFLNEIHPFAEGNGRICRIVINIQLLNEGYPPLLIKDRKKYIDMIIKCEEQKSPLSMTVLFSSCLSQSMEEK